MSERTLLKKVNDLKALEAQKKAIEKQMEALQEDIKKELQARARRKQRWVTGWSDSRLLSAISLMQRHLPPTIRNFTRNTWASPRQ